MLENDNAVAQHYLESARALLRRYKGMAERAMEQVSDEQLHWQPDPEANSLAINVRHLAGNMRSRWRDFLTTDGEKPDRHRDREFEVDSKTREEILADWEDGWRVCLETVDALGPQDLMKTITIRQKPQTVMEAINRQLTHYSYHIGQMVWIARMLVGPEPKWKTLSIPRGKSVEYNRSDNRR